MAARDGPTGATRRIHGRQVRLLAWMGVAGIVAFAAAAVALHLLSARTPWYMSEFANGPYGWLWATGLYSFVLGGASLTVALRRLLPATPARRRGIGLLALAGFGSLLLASFPVDASLDHQTPVGVIHNVSAIWTFLVLVISMAALAPAFRTSARWRRMATASLAFAGLVGVSFVLYFVGNVGTQPFVMLAQRVMVCLIAAWFVLLAIGLLRVARALSPRRRARRGAGRASAVRPARVRARERTVFALRLQALPLLRRLVQQPASLRSRSTRAT